MIRVKILKYLEMFLNACLRFCIGLFIIIMKTTFSQKLYYFHKKIISGPFSQVGLCKTSVKMMQG